MTALVSLRDVEVSFGPVRALAGFALTLEPGRRIALVGASGSGKSTALNVIAGLVRPTRGDVQRRERLRIGLLQQDPLAAVNPRWSVARVVEEPLLDLRPRPAASERHRLVRTMLEAVGLSGAYAEARAAALSGGQCQRVAIARALVARPDLVLADEPTSALDASVGAGVMTLFRTVIEESGAAVVIVSHDLFSVTPVADEIGVMDGGSLVELRRTDDVLRAPEHPATQRLVAAARAMTIDAEGDV
jgi:ABC-type dipeptide/oligopeptide/nickel transport system ATPase subunit